MKRITATVATTLVAAALAFASTSVAASGPDGYDKALLKTLAGQSKMLDTISPTADSGLDKGAVASQLKACGQSVASLKDPTVAFALPFLLVIPTMFEELGKHQQEIASVRDVVAGFRPHAAVFKEYISATIKQADAAVVLARSIDTRKIVVCGLVKAFVKSNGNVSEAQMFRLLGISPAIGAKLAAMPEVPKSLTQRWNAFVRASGLPASTMSLLLES